MKTKNQLKLLWLPFFLLAFIFSGCGNKSEEITTTPPVVDTLSVSSLTASVNENPSSGASLGTVQATSNNTIQYSITSQTVAGALAINATTGEITVADASLFDFEKVQTITADILVSAGTLTEPVVATINIVDVVEKEYVVWTGPTLTFTKDAGGDPTNAMQQDMITKNVIFTRGNTGGQIYNIVSETAYDKDNSPVGTEWALGTISEIASLRFQSFRVATGGKPKNAVGKDMVARLITDDVYISLKITSWDDKKDGGFTYERSTSTATMTVSN